MIAVPYMVIMCAYINKFIQSTIYPISRFIAIILLVTCSHWAAILAYSYFCVPTNAYNILTSMFMMASPVCMTINKFQMALADNYISILTMAGTTIVAWLVTNK